MPLLLQRGLLPVVGVALLFVSACGANAVNGPARATEESGHDEPPVTTCQSLVDSKWVPPPGEPSVTWDPETGDAIFTFDEEPGMHLNILKDERCSEVPVVGPLVVEMQTGAQRDLLSECTQTVKWISGGKVPTKEGVTPSEDALVKYVDASCPAAFSEAIPETVRRSLDER